MSRARRRQMVDREHPKLSVVRQCSLLGISRSSVYSRPREADEYELELMSLIDRQYLVTPFYGSRRMAVWLKTQGHAVNRKRVQRLMRLMGIEAVYRRPNTSKPSRHCVECGSPMWIHQNIRGRARIYCKKRAKGSGCVNRGTFLDVYEVQVKEYLHNFIIPEDYKSRIMAMYDHLEQGNSDIEVKRRGLEGRLERMKNLYEWGDSQKKNIV